MQIVISHAILPVSVLGFFWQSSSGRRYGDGQLDGQLPLYNTGMALEESTDQEFVKALRVAIERYLKAVDEWESAYRKYYRLPGYAAKISGDLEAEHRAYSERRSELEQLLPRARRLCLKHRLRDAFRGLVRVSLGRYAPQHRV